MIFEFFNIAWSVFKLNFQVIDVPQCRFIGLVLRLWKLMFEFAVVGHHKMAPTVH